MYLITVRLRICIKNNILELNELKYETYRDVSNFDQSIWNVIYIESNAFHPFQMDFFNTILSIWGYVMYCINEAS